MEISEENSPQMKEEIQTTDINRGSENFDVQ
jgi:hypothetical protein